MKTSKALMLVLFYERGARIASTIAVIGASSSRHFSEP
jgi:hypothetical protein